MSRFKEPKELYSRADYQEILLARMAAGDLYANEERMKLRRVDQMLDRIRIAFGEKPLYESTEKPLEGKLEIDK